MAKTKNNDVTINLAKKEKAMMNLLNSIELCNNCEVEAILKVANGFKVYDSVEEPAEDILSDDEAATNTIDKKEITMAQITLTKEQIENMGTMTMRKTIINLGYDTIEIKNSVEGKSTTEKYRKFLLSLIETEADVQEDTEEQVNNHELMHGETTVTHEVVATDHAYYNEQFTAFEGNKEQCEEYVEANKDCNEGSDANLTTYVVQEKQAPIVAPMVTPVVQPVTPAPEKSINDVWNADTATKVLVNIINKAKSNNFISFISHHMATSAMCEVLTGRPLKDPVTRQDNVFSDKEKKLVAEFRDKFTEKYLIPNGRGTGYNIKAVGMVWYYKKVIYRYQDKARGQVVDYIVDFKEKTITRVNGTGNTTPLDEAAFKKLDDTCTFLKVCK